MLRLARREMFAQLIQNFVIELLRAFDKTEQ